MGKAQEVKGAIPLGGALLARRFPERQQSRLLRVNGQAKARKALGQDRHDPLRILGDFTPDNEVIGVAHQETAAFHSGLHFANKPFIQHVM